MSKKILLVEDDRDIRDALVDVLELEGFEVVTAVNGQDALEQLKRIAAPAMILLDLMMPVKDGFQFRAEQLGLPAIADIPVVIMSADHNIEHKSRQLTVAGYLKKPVEIDALVTTIKGVCG